MGPKGDVLALMNAGNRKVYSVDAHESGVAVNGSEDGVARIWRGYLTVTFNISSF